MNTTATLPGTSLDRHDIKTKDSTIVKISENFKTKDTSVKSKSKLSRNSVRASLSQYEDSLDEKAKERLAVKGQRYFGFSEESQEITPLTFDGVNFINDSGKRESFMDVVFLTKLECENYSSAPLF